MSKANQLDSKRRIRRIKFLSEDLADTKDIVSLVTTEVLDIVNTLHGKFGHNRTDEEEKPGKRKPGPYIPKQRNKPGDADGEEVSEKASSPPWAKKLFREIAKLTHPDKLATGGFTPRQTEERNRLMTAANSAMGNENWHELIDIAIELGILEDLPEDENFLSAVTLRETELDKELSKQKDTFFWHWYQAAGDEKMQVKMINAYMESAGHQPLEETEVLAVIKEKKGISGN